MVMRITALLGGREGKEEESHKTGMHVEFS